MSASRADWLRLVAELNQPALMSASRGDWLHFVLARVRDRLGGQALDFLFEDPYSRPRESGTYQFLLTAIAPAELPSAIALADAWRAAILAEPEILATACEQKVDYVSQQLASTNHAEVFLNSEDGDEPAYLVGFLSDLRDELARASAAGETTIHVRSGY